VLVNHCRQDQSNEKYDAFFVGCFDIGKVAQRVGCMIPKLPPLSVRQRWRAAARDVSKTTWSQPKPLATAHPADPDHDCGSLADSSTIAENTAAADGDDRDLLL
jgi:hypothetical protein